VKSPNPVTQESRVVQMGGRAKNVAGVTGSVLALRWQIYSSRGTTSQRNTKKGQNKQGCPLSLFSTFVQLLRGRKIKVKKGKGCFEPIKRLPFLRSHPLRRGWSDKGSACNGGRRRKNAKGVKLGKTTDR